jgi:hypothetical protein
MGIASKKYQAMKSLYIVLLTILYCDLLGQVPSDSLSNNCNDLCGGDEKCLCECFWRAGQALRKVERFDEAVEHFKMIGRLCGNSLAQSIIDSIRRNEQRFWMYEGGTDGKFAIVNGLGAFVGEGQNNPTFSFSNPEPFEKGIAYFTESGQYFFVDKNAKIKPSAMVFDAIIPMEMPNWYMVKFGDRWRFCLTTPTIDPYFLHHFREDETPNLSATGFNNWREIDDIRAVLEKVQGKYDYVMPFDYGSMIVKKADKCGLIDKNGQEFVALEYDFISRCDDGLASVKKGSQYGFCNKYGHEIIASQYDEAKNLRDGFWSIRKGKHWGLVNKHGQQTSLVEYDEIWDFWGGFAKVRKDNQWGLIDINGSEIIKPQYNDIWGLHDSIFIVKKGRKWGWLDKKGQELLFQDYENI